MLNRDYTKKALDDFGAYVIKQSRANLTRKNKNVTRSLYESLKYQAKASKNSIQVDFLMADYGKFQDQGVKGAKSSARAPKSPFKFGSGSGKKGGLTKGVKRWVRKRGIKFVSNGRKLTFDATARLITRSIYNKGLKATEFFSRPFNAAYEKLPNDLAEAYGLDVESFIKLSLKNYGR